MATYWLNGNDLISTVKRQIAPAGSVLDIGCGIRPQFFIRPNVHVCCEPYKEYIDILRRTINEDRHYIILKASWADAVRMFPEFSVDTVFLIDVIEHLGKEEGKTLLEQTIKLARKQVVIFTPLGFFPQSHTDGKDRWGLNGGAWQEHKSGWMPRISMIHGIFMRRRNFIEKIKTATL
jgi:cyclopropane fatty-acyl-phospholipid synthase-like methyltransferase